ncbi:MAG: FISUMP domain-containing protein [Candidatus Falkowbacteria bacterium]
MNQTKKAFTLIELLVVIAIIGILATISVLALSNARAKSRDAKRAGDVKQIQTALELFFNDNNRYPTVEEWNTGKIYSTSSGVTSTYMQIIPNAPTPADGTCTDAKNTVGYIPSEDGTSYSISFCLGNTTGTLTPGPKCLTPGGIIDTDCSGGGVTACSASTVNGATCSYGGEDYPTVAIGTQVWLAKNLNIGDRVYPGNDNNGTDNVLGTNDDCIGFNSNLIWSCQGYTGIQKYCYDNDEDNCATDGGLYEWAEALVLPSDCNGASSVDNGNGTYTLNCPSSGSQTILAKHQGICPTGWHVPSDDEWIVLEQFLGTAGCDSMSDGCVPAGDKLKSATAWGDSSNNLSGFNAVPTGYREELLFRFHGDYTYIRATTPDPTSSYNAFDRFLGKYYSNIYHDNGKRSDGFPVRCLKN